VKYNSPLLLITAITLALNRFPVFGITGGCPDSAQPLPTLESERSPVWSNHKINAFCLRAVASIAGTVGQPLGHRLRILFVRPANRVLTGAGRPRSQWSWHGHGKVGWLDV
jgi:hypothetical protein